MKDTRIYFMSDKKTKDCLEELAKESNRSKTAMFEVLVKKEHERVFGK